MAHTSANFGGGPYFSAANGTGVKNNGGTVFYGGTLASNSPITRSITTNVIGYRSGISYPGPYIGISETPNGIKKALSTGVFATMTAGRYIMFGYTQYIAGVANTLLSIQGSSGTRKSQNRAASYIRTTHYVTEGGWYYVTGQSVGRVANAGNPPTTQDNNIGPETYPGTYAIPGRLTYLSTGKLASTVSYAAKTD